MIWDPIFGILYLIHLYDSLHSGKFENTKFIGFQARKGMAPQGIREIGFLELFSIKIVFGKDKLGSGRCEPVGQIQAEGRVGLALACVVEQEEEQRIFMQVGRGMEAGVVVIHRSISQKYTVGEKGKELARVHSKLPNPMHKDVKYGKNDGDNVELKKWGKIPKFNFEVKNHIEILENLGLVDFDVSATLSGNGYYVLKGDLALLNQAILQYAIDFMSKRGYTYVEPPLMIRKEILFAALDQGEFDNSIYSIEGEDLCMIGTSEHPILGLHTRDIIDEKDLPKKYFSYTMCFRKEIGSHGINEKGLWRTHQFNKVEQFIFCEPDKSWEMFDELLKNKEDFFQSLEIPYRLVSSCTGDLSVWKAKMIDLEAYRPTTKDYGELTSLSNCLSYQAQSLGIKVRRKDGSKELVHTLNNTCVATSRALVAIVENYQQKDGSIKVPKVLVKYLGKKVIK